MCTQDFRKIYVHTGFDEIFYVHAGFEERFMCVRDLKKDLCTLRI